MILFGYAGKMYSVHTKKHIPFLKHTIATHFPTFHTTKSNFHSLVHTFHDTKCTFRTMKHITKKAMQTFRPPDFPKKHIPRDFHLQNYIFLRLPTHSSSYFVYLHCSGII